MQLPYSHIMNLMKPLSINEVLILLMIISRSMFNVSPKLPHKCHKDWIGYKATGLLKTVLVHLINR